jgi:hypothetical protein
MHKFIAHKFIVTAASAALLAGAAITALQAQEAQGTQGSQEQIIKKKPGAQQPATEAAPGQQQKSGEVDKATEAAPGQMQKSGEAETATEAAPGQVQKQQTGESEQQPAPGQQEQQTGQSEQQPSTETTGSIDINTEQRTEITQVFREVKSEPVDIDVDVSVGVTVPRTVTLQPLPPRVIEIVPAYRGYEYFVLADGRIVIVEPGTLKVVYILVV